MRTTHSSPLLLSVLWQLLLLLLQLFGRSSSGQGSGTVGILTGGLITRALFYEHAISLALIPLINPALYPGYTHSAWWEEGKE